MRRDERRHQPLTFFITPPPPCDRLAGSGIAFTGLGRLAGRRGARRRSRESRLGDCVSVAVTEGAMGPAADDESCRGWVLGTAGAMDLAD
jgi:hypothetical protein